LFLYVTILLQAAEAVVEAAAAAAAAGAPLVVAVTGCKGCGKSAAARLLANSLVSSSSNGGVVYMDLDPGQPELTPAVRDSRRAPTALLLGSL
jgi:polynucleotide 5'-kinase involved in rRNA processing